MLTRLRRFYNTSRLNYPQCFSILTTSPTFLKGQYPFSCNTGKLHADVSAAPCFRVAEDESTDMTDVSQLCDWVRFPKKRVFQRRNALLTSTCCPNERWGYFKCTFGVFWWKKSNLVRSSKCVPQPLKCEERGLLGSWEKEKKYPNVSGVTDIKIEKFQNVMQTFVWVVNFIVSRSLNHRSLVNCWNCLWHRLSWFDDAQWSEVVISWKISWMISEPLPWELHFSGW